MRLEKKRQLLMGAMILLFTIVFLLSLFVGKYPLYFEDLMQKEEQAVKVFWTLRFPRTYMAALTGFGLGTVGMIYQTIFSNPLASPDIIGVSSGAAAGAAFAILFLSGSVMGITCSAFVGSLLAVVLALVLTMLVPGRGKITIILSGLAVQSLAQTILMILKLTADPDKELAAIEYWIMGSLNGITMQDVPFTTVLTLISMVMLFLLYRQILLLSIKEEEAALLGVEVRKMRLLILTFATFIVASVVCVTGIISFVGLIAPHCARLLTKSYRIEALWLSGFLGGFLLLIADMLARSVASSELPVSIFTTLIGAPFLVWLMIQKESV